MPREKSVKQYNTFVGGINTEASQLNFPENASLDEANMLLNVDGSRQRRLGIGFETGSDYVSTSTAINSLSEATRWETYRWDNVNNDPTISLGVIKYKQRLYFLDLFKSNPSANWVGEANISTFDAEASFDFTAINGKLLVVGSGMNQPCLITYDPDGGAVPLFRIDVEYFDLKVRDFWGVDDGYATDFRPSSIDDFHRYNLKNQGWDNSKISSFAKLSYDTWEKSRSYPLGFKVVPSSTTGFYYQVVSLSTGTSTGRSGTSDPPWTTSVGTLVADNEITWRCEGETTGGSYPSNADLISLGEKSDGSWDEDLIKDYLLGTTPAPKGRYILDLYDRSGSRNTESELTGLNVDQESARVSVVSTHFSRIFYTGINSSVVGTEPTAPNYSGFIFFSQVVQNNQDLGKLYQQNDPTSDNFSDLLATDGGYIIIPEMSNVRRMIPFNDQLVILAENGIWSIRSEGGFSALNYDVVKVSNIGAINSSSIVHAEDQIFYWSKAGIYVLSLEQLSTQAKAVDLTINTIKELYDDIAADAKEYAKGYYDPQRKIVGWLYNDSPDFDPLLFPDRCDTELIFSVRLGAFTKNTISNKETDSPYVVGAFITPNFFTSTFQEGVAVEGEQVVVGVDDVYVGSSVRSSGVSQTKYLTEAINPASTTIRHFTLSTYRDTTFHDWITEDYTSFILSGWEILGDIARKKAITHLVMHLKRTETGFDGNLDPIGESSCLVTVRWEWTDDAVASRWSREQQAYRYKRSYIPSGALDTFNTGEEVITTKLKVRGYGKSLAFYIKSEEGKDLHLLGWATSLSGGNTV